MMYCLSATVLFLLLSIPRSSTELESLDISGIQRDLANFNISCKYERCENSTSESLWSVNCHCGKHCIQFGTCCLDSSYASSPQPELKPTCRSVSKGYDYFIVDHCSSPESVWASLCNSEWEGDDDLLKIVPVTSINTSISYKNYFCFRCHEATDEFLYWTVLLENDDDEYIDYDFNENGSLIYNKVLKTWMLSSDKYTDYFPVKLTVTASKDTEKLTHVCAPGVISDCSAAWSDEEVRDKCLSYTAMKIVKRNATSLTYKNIHCALCNFENLDSVICRRLIVPYSGTYSFSFSYLLDINRSDGDLVGRTQKCSEEHIWDPYTKKCRKVTCALPKHKPKNGKCVPE